jgi:cytochrome c oxidase assembly factor CtaG/polyferredoxin
MFFSAGVIALWIALQSPIDELASWLLAAHMTQHFLLTMIAPPLLLLGWPMPPLMAGVPRWLSRDALGPILGWSRAQNVGMRLTHPVTGWLAMVLLTWGWHLPVTYQLALEVPAWHVVEHMCFLWGGLLFWWSVVAPYPWRSPWPRIVMPLYLLSADVANTIVAAILAFSPGAIYPWYESTAPIFGVSALTDQQEAAAIMWVPGQLVYLIPAVVILFSALSSTRSQRAQQFKSIALPQFSISNRRAKRQIFDVLALPVIGVVLKSARVRGGIRWVMLIGALAIIVDGLVGPREASTNIAGTWTWTHWRGFAAITLVAGGNLACMTCPLIAPRTFLRRFITPRFRWPRALSTKWLAAVLIMAWLLSYEIWSLWDSSFATAWIIAGYFVVVTVVDLLFEGATFCKWLCPIGQYQMALSVASPLEVGMRLTDVCSNCQTQDCLRGNAAAPGCGTGLFMPKKVGNLDCTFCLDCVSACPHDNIGLLTRVPFVDITQDRWRSSIGVLAKRMDFMVLLAVIAVGGFANAIAMTEPALAFVQDCSEWMGGNFLAVMCVVLASIIAIALPMVVASLIGSTSRADIRLRFSHMTLSLLPLSIAMWLAHLGFHFVTGFRSALPPLQRAAQDLGVNGLGSPQWSENCCSIMPAWLVPAQFMILGAGLLVSLSLMWSRAERSIEPDIRTSLPTMFAVARRGFIGMLASLCWWAIGVWIVLQPMQMRGLLNS